ncbi:MAG TPA: HlyD family type I secretion periplasmic adaptor subunit [Pseudomonadales bacterium]|nr:HlyD family type I secretion periplasmic adaptor subunit [Pseudomonadales bacterium]
MKNSFEKTRVQFLPAALEIQHSPPHPLAHWLGSGMIVFFTLCVLWACFGRLDVVAVAEGKIVPSSRVKQIQPLEKGVVKDIFVHEGQVVKAGDPLVALDRTSSGAERERIANELLKTEEMLERARHFLMLLEDKENEAPLSSSLQTLLLEQQWQQYSAQLASLRSQRDNRAAEKQVNAETIIKLQATLPIASKRVNDLKPLVEKKLVAANQYLELEEMRITQQQDLAAARARNTQLAAAIIEIEQQILALTAQTRAQTLSQIADAERQTHSLHEQLTQAKDFDARQVLYAPVTGQVKDLAVNTVGGVVMEAQQLMLVVPDDAQLEAEVWLPNQDIGFVQENDQAVIKVHTFPFTRYGTIDAIVTRISGDAITDEKMAKEKGGLLFGMSLLMAKNTLQVDEREVKLMPGMQVTAEIITGQRRLIEYFLAPLQQHVQESARER